MAQKLDFGRVPVGSELIKTIHFRNSSDLPCFIFSVSLPEWVGVWTHSGFIMPGEDGFMSLVFRPNRVCIIDDVVEIELMPFE